jgi:hypothetical protein
VAFFDLRPYAERLRAMHSRAAIAAAGTALVRPFVVRFGPGFDTVEGPPYASVHWADTSASFRMINPAGRARPAVFSAVVVAKGAVTFHWPGDRVQVVNATPTGTMMRHTLVLPPGSNIATMTTNAPAADGQAADRRVQLSKVRLSDPSFGFGRR